MSIAEHISQAEDAEALKNPFSLPTIAQIRAAFPQTPEGNQKWANFAYNQDSERFLFYELLTKEYIQAFAGYLRERSLVYGGTKDAPIKIMEVAAGTGRFAHFVRKELESDGASDIIYTATDSGSLGLPVQFPRDMMPNVYVREAMNSNPDIVVCSWHPPDSDWTALFRRIPSVKEYLLICPQDSNRCGHKIYTWGVYIPPRPKTL